MLQGTRRSPAGGQEGPAPSGPILHSEPKLRPALVRVALTAARGRMSYGRKEVAVRSGEAGKFVPRLADLTWQRTGMQPRGGPG